MRHFVILKNSFNDNNNKLLELLLILFFAFIAFSRLVADIFLYLELTFYTYAHFIGAGLAFTIIYLIASLVKYKKLDINLKYLLTVLFFAIATGLIAASINRPDIDDAVYAPRAVFYLENSHAIINNKINWIAGLSKEPTVLFFQYYELTQAAISKIFQLNFLHIYHIIAPTIVGALMFIVSILLVTLFDKRKFLVILSIIFLILIILGMGETHRTFGNISLARAYHGKFMFISVGIPAWIYFSIKFFTCKKMKNWLVLLIISFGMVGVTTSSITLIPSISLLLFISFVLFNGIRPINHTIILGAKYLLSFFPLFIAAALIHFSVGNDINSEADVNLAFSINFYDQANYLINHKYPFSLLVFIISATIVCIFSKYRKFFIIWIILAFTLFLNPLVSPYIIKYITTQNLYWRQFYILPFPIIISLAFLLIYGSSILRKIISFTLLMGAVYFAILGTSSVFREDNNATFSPLSYKIEKNTLAAVNEAISNLHQGSMFAPIEFSSNIVILSSKFPQFHIREDNMKFVLRKSVEHPNFQARHNIYNYLYKNSQRHEDKKDFESLISSNKRPDFFVLNKTNENLPAIENILVANKYKKIDNIKNNFIYYGSTFNNH